MVRQASRARLLALLAGSVLFAACSDSGPEQDPATTPTTPTTSAAKGNDVTTTMVTAVPVGTGSGSIGVHFALGNAPTVNTALPIEIAILPKREFTSLRARFEGQNGLTVVSGDRIDTMTRVPANQPIRHKATLMPAQPGVFVVTANIETVGDEGNLSRIFSIPVIVAPAAGAAPPAEAPPAPPAGQPAPAN